MARSHEGLVEWWDERLAERPPLPWWDLNDKQQILLTAWLAIAYAEPPAAGERLPLEFVQAIVELDRVTGRSPIRSPIGRGRRRDNRRITPTAEPGVTPNRHRQIRRRKRRNQLAT